MMASSSSQASHTKYDVFISFRGTDVRPGLLSHLEKELKQKEIDFYLDNRLEKGDEISQALIKAIDESLISLVIFSEDYASSKWCLEELVKIMDCKQRNQQIVIPVFYNIDPSVVRYQIGSYEDAFTKHDQRYKEKVQIWRSALINAANLSGICSSDYKDEAELVEQVTKSVTRLNMLLFPSTLRNLVGIDKKIIDLQSIMQKNRQDVCVIGLWGMGGIGKTTLATAVFNRFCFEYEGSCFLENVREVSQKPGGVVDLKSKLFSSLLKEKHLQIDTSNGLPSHVERKLRRTKVLIVLDDINDSSQLEKLVGELNCFGPGSKIIITTRDKEMLKEKAIKTYEVMPLTHEEALELFNLNAFQEKCRATELHELSRMVIKYARELPLAVKLLGSFLRGKSEQEWRSQLDKLKKLPFKKINDVLRLSYDTLDRHQKNVFLYIACCFKGHQESHIIEVLDACGFSTAVELKVLRDKALITQTSEDESIVSMHDLIEEMGKEIVREESEQDPCKYRHLWDFNDIREVLENEKGTKYIQSITLDKEVGGSNLCLSPQVFSKMQKLKILRIPRRWKSDFSRIELPNGLESLPNELRFIEWPSYPLLYLPKTFCAKNLVQLCMPDSNLQKLWQDAVPLKNLRKIDLRRSMRLFELPDLSSAKNLEEVYLDQCKDLCGVHPSILSLPKLKKLYLTACFTLSCLKSDIHLKSLSHLNLGLCYCLKEFSVISKNMIELDLSETKIEKFPLPNGCFGRVETLILAGCESLTHLPSNLVDLTSLCFLNISRCKQLKSIPQLPPSIVQLWADECTSLRALPFTSMKSSGIPLNKNLSLISLSECRNLDGHSCKVIRLLARPTITNYARKSSKERPSHIECQIVYPGRQVPKWFKHRTQQGSITIAPHSKLLGFIFCLILDYKNFTVDWFLRNDDGDDGESFSLSDMGGNTSGGILHPFNDSSFLRVPHVYICYQECSELINETIEENRGMCENPKLSFVFLSFLDSDSDKRMIKECGVHPIYVKEEEEEEEDKYEDEEEEEMEKKNKESENIHIWRSWSCCLKGQEF